MSTLTLENAIVLCENDPSVCTKNDLIIELPYLTCKLVDSSRRSCSPEYSDYELEVNFDEATTKQWNKFSNLYINSKNKYEYDCIYINLLNSQVASITSESGPVDVKRLINKEFVASCTFGFKYITYCSQLLNGERVTDKTTAFKSCRILN